MSCIITHPVSLRGKIQLGVSIGTLEFKKLNQKWMYISDTKQGAKPILYILASAA